MNNSRFATIFGLIAGVSELFARSGVLGDRSIYADGVFAVSMGILGWLTQGRPAAAPAVTEATDS